MKPQSQHSLPSKANRILNVLLVVLLLISIRIWHLAVAQHEEKIHASKKPQKRTIIEKSDRATITDRFDKPLAINKIKYNISVTYGGIREVPRTIWKRDSNGKKIKIPARKEYITHLSQMLAKELDLDSTRIEDLIHSKATLFGNIPFILKENVSEEIYFHLKALEKDWPGLFAEKTSTRDYPQGPVGADVIGYLGAISKDEYETIMDEMQELREALHSLEEGEEKELPKGYVNVEQVGKRLKELERKAYTINDLVGKSGVEKSFDEKLRGTSGMRAYISDPRGTCLEELEGGYPPQDGVKLKLAISSELQAYAEQLLTEYEQAPLPSSGSFLKLCGYFPEKQPWIKGGAIVVMDPNNGEILSLASYPRFNPNDFVKRGKNDEVEMWLENEDYIGALWDQKRDLIRSRFDVEKGEFFDETLKLSWHTYLKMILPSYAPVLECIEAKDTLQDAIYIQNKIDELLSYFKGVSLPKILNTLYSEGKTNQTVTLKEQEQLERAYTENKDKIAELKCDCAPYFNPLKFNGDKLLLVDLYRLSVDPSKFSSNLLSLMGKQTLKEYRECGICLFKLKDEIEPLMRMIFHETHFKKWREEKFKDYLAQKRKEEEAAKKKWGKPYLDYLDEAEKKFFSLFWEINQWNFVLWLLEPSLVPHSEEVRPYFEKLKEVDASFLKEAVADLDSSILLPYLKTHRRYSELKRPLLGIYSGLRNEKGLFLEKHLAGAFYPRQGYGYARSYAFRQSASIGSVFKVIPAYEAMRQLYFDSQRKGKVIKNLNPLTIIDDKKQKGDGWIVGYTLNHEPIPRYYRGGLLPRSDHFAIGEVDVVDALASSSNPYFAMLSGDILQDPEDLCRAAKLFSYGEKTEIDLPGEIKGNIPEDVSYNRTGLYSFSIGQHSLVGTPLQTAVMLSALANGGKVLKPKVVLQEGKKRIQTEVRREIFLPKLIRKTILRGLREVVKGEKGTARMLQNEFPKELIDRVVGKTSTAEAIERVSLDAETGKVKFKHVGFNAICFKDGETFENPELVVVVYLRFGDFGRKAAPYAIKMIQKWEEICARVGDE